MYIGIHTVFCITIPPHDNVWNRGSEPELIEQAKENIRIRKEGGVYKAENAVQAHRALALILRREELFLRRHEKWVNRRSYPGK